MFQTLLHNDDALNEGNGWIRSTGCHSILANSDKTPQCLISRGVQINCTELRPPGKIANSYKKPMCLVSRGGNQLHSIKASRQKHQYRT